jgi:hypothetical protein
MQDVVCVPVSSNASQARNRTDHQLAGEFGAVGLRSRGASRCPGLEGDAGRLDSRSTLASAAEG